jgi:hypothetical protein
MKLTTVLGSVNNNKKYYMFIPKQIYFWNKFNIKFIAIFVGDKIPEELNEYHDNIILWNKNLDLNTAYIGQNIRMYYPALLNLPDDEMVMITDMDMLPTKDNYYKDGLENFKKDDFIYYRYIHNNEQIFMCYNASHPSNWSKLFNIYNENDIEEQLLKNYSSAYSGIPGDSGWFVDQLIMYRCLIKYQNLKVLDRPINRLEVRIFRNNLNNGENIFINKYDDVHFHRSYYDNEDIILHAEKQLNKLY